MSTTNFLAGLATLFVISSNCSAQNFNAWAKKADSLHNSKNYGEAGYYFEKAISAIKETYVEANDFYRCAASYTMAGDINKASFYITKAVNKGGVSSEILKRNNELSNLQRSKQWPSIIDHAEKMEINLNIALIDKLKTLENRDQFYRKKMDSMYKSKEVNSTLLKIFKTKQFKLDSIIIIETKEVFDKFGFPTRLQVGEQNMVLFFVVQHSDLKTMELYYPLFEKAAENGDLSWRSLCLMTDRIRKRKHLKQIYGTQITTDANGKSILYEVEDFENLNKRRLSIGLEPIEEYVKFWDIKL